MKPALVFLCQRIPYPPIKGERITSFNFLRHLTKRYRVFLGTFIDDPADRQGIPFLQSMVEELHVDENFRRWTRLRALLRWLGGEPISFGIFRSTALSVWLDQVEARHRPIAIVTHSSNISAYAVEKFQRGGNGEPRRILHFADVDSEKFRAYSKRARGLWSWVYSVEAQRVRREECRLAAMADAVAFVSDEEANLFRSLLVDRPGRIVTLPNGVDTDTFDPRHHPRGSDQTQDISFIFTGAMDYSPNTEAVEWFAKRVLPKVRATLPSAQFWIVGAKPTSAVRALARKPWITVTGRVDSVVPFLARAQVAVAPLQIARGVQNKVLEAMAMAKPIVATTAALTGIAARAGEHLLRADTPDEWIQACVRLINEPHVAWQIGAAARELVLQHYSWDIQFARLDELLA